MEGGSLCVNPDIIEDNIRVQDLLPAKDKVKYVKSKMEAVPLVLSKTCDYFITISTNEQVLLNLSLSIVPYTGVLFEAPLGVGVRQGNVLLWH